MLGHWTMCTQSVHAQLVVTVHAAFNLAQETLCLSEIVHASIKLLYSLPKTILYVLAIVNSY